MRNVVSPMLRSAAAFLSALLLVGSVASPSAALPSDHARLEKNKDVVEQFFKIANSGKVADLKAIVREDYIEHSDIPDFRDGLAQALATNPTTPITATYAVERHRIRGDIVRMIAERDHVWTYSAVIGPQSQVARIDMFRLSGGQIAEHWSVVDQIPEKRGNDNDAFALGRGTHDYKSQPRRIKRVTTQKEADHNRQIGRQFYQSFRARSVEGMQKVIGENYIQHHFTTKDGGWAQFQKELTAVFTLVNAAEERAKAAGTPAAPGAPYGPVRILTEGNLVWVFVANGQEPAQFNQYTVVDGKLGEHFGTYETFPSKRQNNNNFMGYGRGPAFDYSDY